jgi:RHS repeat-associated protein
MQMPGRKFNEGDYRYGFNGQEVDNEVKGNGNSLSFRFRNYDPRLGRMISIDPLTSSYPYWTPYAFAANMPIWAGDTEGLQPKFDNRQDRRLKPVLEAKTPAERELALQAKRDEERAEAWGVVAGLAGVALVEAPLIAELAYQKTMAIYTSARAAEIANEVTGFFWGLFTDEEYPLAFADNASKAGRHMFSEFADDSMRPIREGLGSAGSYPSRFDLDEDFIPGVETLTGYADLGWFDGETAYFMVSVIERLDGYSGKAFANLTSKAEEVARKAGLSEVRIKFDHVMNSRLSYDSNWALEYGYNFHSYKDEFGVLHVEWTKSIE